MTMIERWRLGARLAVAAFLAAATCAIAQVAPGSPGGTPPAARKTAPKAAPQKPGAAPPATAEGQRWRTGPVPAWVVEPPPVEPATVSTGAARRDQLIDLQMQRISGPPSYFVRNRAVANDPSMLSAVSQPRIQFNPAFQRVVVHGAAVWREGRKVERLREARLELMRRETGLEQQMIDGTETLLVVIADVRVGEPVEVAYTVEGENPIYEGRLAAGLQLAGETPIDLLHLRLTVPADRRLTVRAIGGSVVEPERTTADGRQVLRVVRRNVDGIAFENGTPPWFKVYPAVQVSDYDSWSDVDAWAQRLFAPRPAGPALKARIDAFRASGLQGAALASEVLRFVQDEVRYFSASLGESSHRPKPAEQTLTELLGDCKDKVVLLNALLTELGFDAKPALVSILRNRGLMNLAPAHDAFDHVITRLQLDGQTWWVDATNSGQGTTLATRGQFPYGAALVVGEGAALVPVPESARAPYRLEFEQRWDLSKPGAGALLTTTLRAHGRSAEQWRDIVAKAGEPRIAEALGGGYTKVMPGLAADGAMQVADDRQANILTFTQRFTHPSLGEYSLGGLDIEAVALELYEYANGPNEARRRAPWLIDQPLVVDGRIVFVGPRAFPQRTTPPQQVQDRHLNFSARVDMAGNEMTISRRIERRADEVLPADLAAYRESLLKLRQLLSGRVRLPLVDVESALPEIVKYERRLMSARSARRDALTTLLLRNEASRILDTQTLAQVPTTSPLAVRIRVSRAQALNHLGDFTAALADADAALAVDAASEGAIDARGVALAGLGRMDDAIAEFRKLRDGSRRATAAGWMGTLELQAGRAPAAEALLQEAVAAGSGGERDFALLWLFLAAEQQGAGRGREAVGTYLDQADAKSLPGAMLHYLAGRMDRDALVKVAREKPDMERLNLAEAYFYIGKRYAVQGQRDEAMRWFERVMETGATPYREVTFAGQELRRGK